MLVPLSWLKEYVSIKMPLPKLVERLSEVGIGVENVHKGEEDTVLELEITPNRPDLLSIVGIAREVAAIQKAKIKIPTFSIPKPRKKLPITIKNNLSLCERFTGIIIDGVKVKESPLWLSTKLASAGLRPINNIVDITNFVMLELGNPIHAFDYDQIKGHTMIVTQAVGGEPFTSVDNISYKLPKGAIVIKDEKRIIDLCGIKGAANSGISKKTKTIFLRVPVDDGKIIRRTSIVLSLRSEASSIFERGVNKGGTLDTLSRAISLILNLSGGKVASDIIDLKKHQFNPWHVTLSLDRLSKILGIDIEEKKVVNILGLLNLTPQKAGKIIKCTIPAYRNDLQIEEDLIEEVARMYGYNKFPKTLPKGEIPTADIPYQKDLEVENKVKYILASFGLSEANTYSLVSQQDLELISTILDENIIIANPVSREFELMRPSLLINLLKATPANLKHTDSVSLFELGRIYKRNGKDPKETRSLATVLYPANYFDAKGVVEALFEALQIKINFEPINAEKPYSNKKVAGIFAGKEMIGTLGELNNKITQKLALEGPASCLEIDFERLNQLMPKVKVFKLIPKHPPIIEDLSIVVDREILTGKIIEEIKSTSALIVDVSLLDIFENTRTFRLTFQNPQRNLSSPEVYEIRKQILKHLKKKFNAELKS